MGDIDVGGDRSVMWKVDVGHLRLNSAHDHPSPGAGPGHGAGGHHQDGIDETIDNQFFTIYIEVPRDQADKNNLTNALSAASTAMGGATAGSGAKVAFTLRIEGQNEDQIKIAWDSMP